jgi:hypothetical protein
MRCFTAEFGVCPRRRFNAAVQNGFDAYVLAECLRRFRSLESTGKAKKSPRKPRRSASRSKARR